MDHFVVGLEPVVRHDEVVAARAVSTICFTASVGQRRGCVSAQTLCAVAVLVAVGCQEMEQEQVGLVLLQNVKAASVQISSLRTICVLVKSRMSASVIIPAAIISRGPRLPSIGRSAKLQ